MRGDHVWRQIETILASACERVVLISPFVKQEMFKAALAAVPSGVDIVCVTRWSLLEVAAGVSDPEVAEIAEQDGRARVLLCHDLHAKLYLADDQCLVGSANLTARATGRRVPSNIELLIGAPASHPEVVHLLDIVGETAIPADVEQGRQLRMQADALIEDAERGQYVMAADERDRLTPRWRPQTRAPFRLYQVYRGRGKNYPRDIFTCVAQDLGYLDLEPGLDERAFSKVILTRLREMPEIASLAARGHLSLEGLQQEIADADDCDESEARRSAETIAEWLRYFGEARLEPTGPWQIVQGRVIS